MGAVSEAGISFLGPSHIAIDDFHNRTSKSKFACFRGLKRSKSYQVMPAADGVLLTIMLKIALLEKKGSAFEDLFVQAAIALWGDDFEPWKPQGSVGDFKCDGYLISEQTVFQCNAPEKFQASTVAGKIQDDFEGARMHFGAGMKKWVFVHNQKELPSKAEMLINELREKYPDIKIRVWSPDHIIRELQNVPKDALLILFPTLAQGLAFSDGVLDQLKSWVNEASPTTPDAQDGEPLLQNRTALDDALENLSHVDQDIRRRLLGYSKWFDPANKIEIYERVIAAGYDKDIVENNAIRLNEAALIQITELYILPKDDEICQSAAESLIDELLRELDG